MTPREKPRIECTQEIAQAVIAALYDGVVLAQFIDKHPNKANMPAVSAIRAFINTDNALKAAYTHAREACADQLAEQVVLEADDTHTDPTRARNRMAGRQWLAAKLQPKVYGDKLDLDVTNRIDVASAVLAARDRAMRNITPEPLTIEHTDASLEPVVDPFT